MERVVMTRSIWFKCFSATAPPTATVAKELARLGFAVHPDNSKSREGDCCVAAISEVDAKVVAEIEQLSQSNHVVVLSTPVAKILPEARWQLLHAGVADVLDWTSDGMLAAQIAARVDRWAEIERLADDASIRRMLVGDSPAWRSLVRKLAEIAAFSSGNLLIVGETGTGKERIAEALHVMDRRPHKVELVVVDCATLSPELSGSELFGHERGAFTGAIAARDGAFARANGGTLFLDEVGELPLTLQAELLRVIQEGMYKRVGSDTWRDTTFRLICATNRPLRDAIASGGFRSDLYHRIAAWSCELPPLRERTDDIIPLATHFLSSLIPSLHEPPFDPAVTEFIRHRSYPGNVRDLRLLMARIAARHVGDGPVTVGSLPDNERPESRADARTWWQGAF